MNFNPAFLDYKPIFNQDELKILEDINQTISLEFFLNNKNLVEKFSFDFIYTSAKIEGNTYSKAEALTLLDYGKTAGGKSFSDAKMLINLKKAFDFIINDDCAINKYKIRTLHSILADELIDDKKIGVARDKGVLSKEAIIYHLIMPCNLRAKWIEFYKFIKLLIILLIKLFIFTIILHICNILQMLINE